MKKTIGERYSPSFLSSSHSVVGSSRFVLSYQMGVFMRYITNAFSLNMLESLNAVVTSTEIYAREAARLGKDAVSIVGHPDTAAVMASVLGIPVVANRATVLLKPHDELIVGQYRGPRLPEGVSTLPEGARIDWARVRILT